MFLGGKVKLKTAEETDLFEMVKWSLKPEISTAFNLGIPASSEEIYQWYKKLMTGRNSKLFSITDYHDKLIGFVAISNLIWKRKEAEINICIGVEGYWNSGYGTDAIITLLEYSFKVLNLESLYLRVFSKNKRAIKCYQKCGFSKEGYLKKVNEEGKEERVILMRVFKEKFFEIAASGQAG